jgi:hypothetical protein
MDNLNETESATPVNAMGSSTSAVGSGGINTYDPMLKPPEKNKKKLRKIIPKNKG